VCADRARGLEAEAKTIVAEALLWLRSQDRIGLHGFVVMRDHFHALLSVRAGVRLSQVMHSLNSFTAKRINALRGQTGAVWQGGFREDAMHDLETAEKALQYMADNPVRAGVAATPADYPWSSAHESFRRYLARL
jgi:REP element-mobilizing transposase RayT